MRIEQILLQPKMYINKEITLTGILHCSKYKTHPCFLTASPWKSPNLPTNKQLPLHWKLPVTSNKNTDVQKILIDQLIQTLSGNISINSSKIERHVNDHLLYYQFTNLMSVFDSRDSSWKSISNPFIDNVVESKALDILAQLAPYAHPLIELINLQTRFEIEYNPYYDQLPEGQVTGVLSQLDDNPALIDVWKVVVPTSDCDIYIVTRDLLDFLNNFDNTPSVQLKTILREPDKYFGKQLTIRGLFSNDFVNFGNNISYARILPNRLYYEYRSKWDNRISLHLKPSQITQILTSFRRETPGIGYVDSPNEFTSEVRITGTLYPPENEYSSVILDDITDLVSLHEGKIYHWKPEALKYGLTYDL